MGNVTAVNTTLAGGQTDNQVFCYDEQDRLTWAGSNGTPPSTCGHSLTPGSLSAAYYTQSFSYDTYDRLTSGPLGSYTYGDSNHLHAATAAGSGPTYTASYDGAGNMVCRAPNPAVGSCALGQNTGQQLTYDAEGRLSHWQNVPGGNPNATAAFRYDGEGERVAQQSTSSGTTTTTRYLLGGLEELTTTGGTSTLTKYYSVPGVVTAIKVGTTLSYLATDGLGSVSVALAAAGSTTGQALYLPYGAGRYSSGSLPTARGYTGQYQDSTSSGLDYYGARYYDPVLGQFTSADSVLDGLNRYAYVHGNPETATDPSGHLLCFQCMYGGGGTDQGWSASWAAVELVDSLTFNVIGMYHDVRTILNSKASGEAKWAAAADLLISLVLDALMFTGEGEAGRMEGAVSGPVARAVRTDEKVVGDLLQAGDGAAHAGEGGLHPHSPHTPHLPDGDGLPHNGDGLPHNGDGLPHNGDGSPHGPSTPPVGGCGESFAPDTLVETPSGERPISRLRVGDAVAAYDPASGTTSVQTVEHVFINHDTDRLDVTLAVTDMADGAADSDGDGGAAGTGTSASTRRVPLGVRTATSDATDGATDLHLAAMGAAHRAHRVRQELIHTTASHPWLTADRGWVRAGTLALGEWVVRADGSTAPVVGLRAVDGTGDMWDLTVSNVHTFAVGVGAYVVHNCGQPPRTYQPSPKHGPRGWGSPMDLDDQTAQTVMEGGIMHRNGRSIWNVHNGGLYVFRPTNMVQNIWHGYRVLPSDYGRAMQQAGGALWRQLQRLGL